MRHGRFDVLIVCTANLCRSPMAERLLRRRVTDLLGDAARVSVTSAGVRAAPDRPMHPYAATALRERGADPDGFRSAPVTAAGLAGADLVLTATREHRARCVELYPAGIRTAYTIRQFARLVAAVPAGTLPADGPVSRARALLAALPAARGWVPQVPEGEDDLADPVNGPVEGFRACAAHLDEVLDPFVRLLAEA